MLIMLEFFPLTVDKNVKTEYSKVNPIYLTGKIQKGETIRVHGNTVTNKNPQGFRKKDHL
jgi:hypothetical protein